MRLRIAAAVLVSTGILFAVSVVGLAFSARGRLEPVEVLYPTVFVVFLLVGAVVAVRRRENPVGWLLATIGFTFLLDATSYEYSLLSETRQDLPGAVLAQWLSHSLWPVTWTPIVLLLLVFPTGRPASRRWYRFTWTAGIGGMVLAVVIAAGSWPRRGAISLDEMNPFEGLAGTAVQALIVFVVGSLAVAALSLIVRFRGATGVERSQLKLLALAMVVLIGAVVSGLVLEFGGWGSELLTTALYVTGLLGIPVSVGVAVLRYRLYEIDRIISRTATYGVVAGLLAAVFAGVAIGLPQLLSLPGESPLLVAASTLTVAALFNPLRRRVQAVVDLRFNRSRYDAQRTVEAFTSRLRDEVDLEQLSAELLVVVTATMQPAQAGVWLRPSGGDSQ